MASVHTFKRVEGCGAENVLDRRYIIIELCCRTRALTIIFHRHHVVSPSHFRGNSPLSHSRLRNRCQHTTQCSQYSTIRDTGPFRIFSGVFNGDGLLSSNSWESLVRFTHLPNLSQSHQDSRSPNKFSYKMLQNLKDLTGTAAPIRIGGTTANHGIYVAGQKEAIIQNFATPGADQPANVTWGPNYLESFKTFPEGTHYTVGVTFDSGKSGEDASVEESRAFYDGIGEDLFAIEVGNEFDGTHTPSRFPGTN
jgi:hypothetical protein